MVPFDIRTAKKIVIAVVGFTILIIGIAFIILPGPGTLIIILALLILSVEFFWARRLLKRIKNEIAVIQGKFR